MAKNAPFPEDDIISGQLLDAISSKAQETIDLSCESTTQKPKDTSIPSVVQNGAPAILQTRAYQREMLEQSLQRNIIVAMDTGSGKTQVAVLRIEAELNRCPPGQLVWFLAPTAALAHQQYNVIRSQLPAFQLRLLLGADNVDLWSEQRLWDSVLLNVQIVVSTHQILLDALTHGFVRMSRLALLVFDEAHHCVSSHPANGIMQDFYHPLLRSNMDITVPHILGLTASPTVNAKAGSLEAIERNLNSISRTPNLHRQELLRFVYPPEIIGWPYLPCRWINDVTSGVLQTLHNVYKDLDIWQDPYVVRLVAERSDSSERQLQKVLHSRRTYCLDQMRMLYSRSIKMFEELGSWAAEVYLVSCIKKFRSHVESDSKLLNDWEDEEKVHLLGILSRLDVGLLSAPVSPESWQLSQKAHRFIDLLVQQDLSDFTGLVFVQERATVGMLSHLLSIHPRTKDGFLTSTFVGTSTSKKRKMSIGELLDVRDQKDTLDDLRYGRKNLVIATSVLEEGIDVSACNIVICFDKPVNLKSFIQRRGRARKEKSKFVLMFSSDDSFTSSQWRDLEDDMKKAYQDDMRELKEIQQEEDVIEEGCRCFRVDSTGALLTLENAVQHLYHFCATLPASSYVDLRPEFVFSEASKSDLVSARVILPNSVDPSVREAQGELKWKTQRNAKRDAAFEAYVALHRAGLVNDHLLPLLERDSEVVDGSSPVETRAALVDVAQQLNPWRIVAQQWQEAQEAQTVAIEVRGYGESLSEMVMILPQRCPSIPNFQLHLDQTTSLTAFILEDSSAVYRFDEITHAPEISAMLLRSTFGSRMHTDRSDFPALFVPCIRPSNLESWLASVKGVHAASDILEAGFDHRSYGLVRDLRHDGKLHILKDVTRNIPESHQEKLRIEVPAAVDSLYLEVIRLPKRTDFLHSLPTAIDRPVDTVPRTEYLPASSCQVGRLPFACSQFALFIPSIMHRLEVFMVAEHLCDKVLSPVAFNNVGLVVTAISASGAQEGTNYQRLEFLGDSILKLFTSITLMAEYPKWHEGFLSAKKDHVVANARLSRAAVEVGLDQYILTKHFTGHKWRPLYNFELLKPATESKRQMSTKVLADVVEALIGAAYVDGIDEKALSCLKVFLPEIPWLPLSQRLMSLYDTVTSVGLFPPRFSDLERLVGYDFNKKTLLIEAMTHPTYSGSNSAMSYQRLEFLGDSVLDSIVVAAVFANDKQLAHYQMHTMRTILVNAGFLAFLCMEHSIPETRTEVIEDESTGTFHTTESTIPLHIWQFMRYTSPQIARAQKACIDRYEELHQSISASLQHGTHYPWALLARLEADKFFSDLIESLLGAIYIDSHGALPACEAFLERIGLLPYLRRILTTTDMKLLHPKEEVGLLAGTEKVGYVHGLDEGKTGFWCEVVVGGRVVVRVGEGTSRGEVETRAAQRAVKRLVVEKKDLGDSGGGGDEDMVE